MSPNNYILLASQLIIFLLWDIAKRLKKTFVSAPRKLRMLICALSSISYETLQTTRHYQISPSVLLAKSITLHIVAWGTQFLSISTFTLKELGEGAFWWSWRHVRLKIPADANEIGDKVGSVRKRLGFALTLHYLHSVLLPSVI